MPALNSPEVIVETTQRPTDKTPLPPLETFETIFLSQQEHEPDEAFNPGPSKNAELVMLGNMGLNPIFNEVRVSTHLARALGSESNITMSLILSDHWSGKDSFMAEMAEKKVYVREEPTWGNKTEYTVYGIDDIFKTGEVLRDRYDNIELEIDPMLRPVIHPELLGLVLEHVDQQAATLPKSTKGFAHGAYHHDWDAGRKLENAPAPIAL